MTKETSVNDDFLAKLSEISEIFTEAMKAEEANQEKYWNSLTKDQQLMVFCAVMRRLVEGELEKNGSYRYILYEVFEFGAESYMQAQNAGYIELHNSIYTKKQLQEKLVSFAEKMFNASNKDAVKKADKYLSNGANYG